MAKRFGLLIFFVYILFISLVGLIFIRNYTSTRNAYLKIARNYISGIKQTFTVFSCHRDMKLDDISRVIDKLTNEGEFDYLAYVIGDSVVYWQSKYDYFLPVEPGISDSLRIVKTIDHDILEFNVNLGENSSLVGGYSLKFLDVILKKQKKTGLTLVLFSTLIFLIALIGILKFHERIVRMEARIREEEAEKKRFQELSSFSSLIAHEIKNPLNTINLALQMIESRYGKDKYTDMIRNETRRLISIVNDFRSLSRPIKLKITRCSLRDLVYKVSSGLQTELGKKISVRVNEETYIICDPHWMEQLIYNILKNSIEAKATEVVINVKKSGNQFLLEIRDNGKGMDEEELSHIFDMFYTTKTRGLGLGMYLVKKIVEEHGGEINASSSPGKGVKFTIKIPSKIKHPQKSS